MRVIFRPSFLPWVAPLGGSRLAAVRLEPVPRDHPEKLRYGLSPLSPCRREGDGEDLFSTPFFTGRFGNVGVIEFADIGLYGFFAAFLQGHPEPF